MNISPGQFRNALLYMIAFIISVSVHEFGHAWAANKLGDSMPRAQGRLTLSPMAHVHWLGTIVMPLLGAFMPGVPLIAWGKPVMTNPGSYSTRRFSRRTGHMLVALAGPAMNLILAITVSIIFIVLAKTNLLSQALAEALVRYVLALNLVLMFFNLLPVPPLDGATVLAGILPDSMQGVSVFLQRYGLFIFFALFMIPGVMPFLLGPAYRLTQVWVGVLAGFVSA